MYILCLNHTYYKLYAVKISDKNQNMIKVVTIINGQKQGIIRCLAAVV